MTTHDENAYIEIFLEPIRKCSAYRPKFGNSSNSDGFNLSDFKTLYGADPFYSWIGLDDELVYSAHRAAGGMTSVYRQIGIGCERLFRKVLIDTTGYDESELATWSYITKTKSGKDKKLSLDGRLELNAIKNETVRKNVVKWMNSYCSELGGVKIPEKGIVFEVRQGYKSKDSKRQNADIDNATVAWSHDYFPVFSIFSSQIDSDIVLRYQNNRCGVLVGSNNDNPYISLYAFCRDVLSYDLADFFNRRSGKIKEEMSKILTTLLSAE